MPKLYIVEGPDCSGKTALAKFLCRKLGAVYIHASGSKDFHAVMQAYHEALIATAEANIQLGLPVVMDRLWPSEYVYGMYFRPHVSERVYSYHKIFEKLDPLHPHYIFCHDDEIPKRHREHVDPSHPYSDTDIVAVMNGYVELVDSCFINGLNVTKYSIQEHGHALDAFLATLP